MKAQWQFNEANPSDVRIEVTQKDQFDNDDVALAEAVVRESIQNSSDALVEGEKVAKVRFAIKSLGPDARSRLSDCIAGLSPHFHACRLDKSTLEGTDVRVLTIEDFNTTGLTGSFHELDRDNFDNFWRAIGDTEKKNQKGGRWGLGKLVYPSSSKASLFFGLTMREGDEGLSALGQVVLSSHRIGKDYYRAHGFWFDGRSEIGLQLPTLQSDDINFLRTIADVSRTDQTGLSVIIPYLLPSITEQTLILGVLTNYYFPILSGRLEVEVGDTIIDQQTFLQVAEKVGVMGHRTPFDFILGISEHLDSTEYFQTSTAATTKPISADTVTAEDVLTMKDLFSKKKLVHFRLPIELEAIDKERKIGHIDLFLQALSEGQAPYSLFARGPITLPGERHFAGVARGAMIARDDDVAALLGDAENPAHTAWNSNANKLHRRWINGKAVLTAVRQSLRDLYNLVAEQAETEDEDALIDFFSIVDKAETSAGKKKKAIKPKIEIPPRETAIRIRPLCGGFELKAGPGAANWTFPRIIRVRMAYDMIGANPFKSFSKFDFDLQNEKTIVSMTEESLLEAVNANTFKLTANGPNFVLKVEGFDQHRDIVVDARAL